MDSIHRLEVTAMFYPGGIVFVNEDVSPQVVEVLKRQLYITEQIDYNTLQDRFNEDGYYIYKVRENLDRILVLINYTETPRDSADVVIYIRLGLAYIEKNNFGPPGLAMQVDRLYINSLLRYNDKI